MIHSKHVTLVLGLVALLLVRCTQEESGEWLVPQNEVKDGGPGKDGIPALLNPEMWDAAQADYLEDEDLVIGYKIDNDVRAYPHKILDWHEIINDEIGGVPVAITYCPLTGTGVGWGRNYNGTTTTFGVSGLLYNTNLMPYDRATNSTWSQIRLQSVNGDLIGTQAETFQVFETTWATWKALYPDTKVVSTSTGHNRNYSRYPYGDYRTEPGLIFSVSVNDTRLPQKERVHGVIVNNRVKTYPFSAFGQGAVIVDAFEGQDMVIVGSQPHNYIISFFAKTIDGVVLDFQLINGPAQEALFRDQLGNKWNPFGLAIEGPNAGEKLTMTQSFIGMWFSWAPFYENPEIYGE